MACAPLAHATLHSAAFGSRVSMGAATGAVASPSTSASGPGEGAAVTVTAVAEARIVRALMNFIVAG